MGRKKAVGRREVEIGAAVGQREEGVVVGTREVVREAVRVRAVGRREVEGAAGLKHWAATMEVVGDNNNGWEMGGSEEVWVVWRLVT